MKLAVCKWCGSKSPVFKPLGENCYVECTSCGANSWSRKTKEQAAAIWATDQFESGKR